MEYEKYLYDTEQMKADVRAYIADGIHRKAYWENEEKQSKKDTKTEKIIQHKNEEILEVWDKVDYFEKVKGKDIFDVIPYLDEEEKQFIIRARELRNSINQNNQTLPKRLNNNKYYFKKTTDKINVAKDKLNIAATKEEKYKLQEEIKKLYIEIGWYYLSERLEPYLDQFTQEEQQYIYEGRMAKIGSEYAEGAEKARKFLKTSAAFKKAGDRITQVGVDFNKDMTEKGEELGDKVRQAGVKLSPLIINVGDDVIEFTDNLDNKKDAMFDNLQDKIDDVFAKRIWREIKKHIKKECLKIVPNAPEKAIEIKAKDVYFQSRDYILNEYPTLKQKAEEIRENYIQHNGQDINEEEFQAYLSTQIPDYEKYKNFTKYYNDYYDIFVRRTYEYVNS